MLPCNVQCKALSLICPILCHVVREVSCRSAAQRLSGWRRWIQYSTATAAGCHTGHYLNIIITVTTARYISNVIYIWKNDIPVTTLQNCCLNVSSLKLHWQGSPRIELETKNKGALLFCCFSDNTNWVRYFGHFEHPVSQPFLLLIRCGRDINREG